MPTKKTVKKSIAKKTTNNSKMSDMAMPETPKMTQMVAKPTAMVTKRTLNSRFLTIALIIVGIALLTYKFGPWLVPAIVDNRPVTRFELWSRMEKSFGAQTLDDVVNEYALESAITDSGIKVDQAKIDEQMSNLETQFEGVGGLDEALTQRGLTREDLVKQVKTQLAVEQILSDKVSPTDEEVQAYFDDNAETLYKDQEFDTVKEEVRAAVKDSKLRDAFLEWFAEVKDAARVKNFGL